MPFYKFPSLLRSAILFPFWAIISLGCIQAQEVPVSARPDWVIKYHPQVDWENTDGRISGSDYSLLIDKQINIPRQEYYFHRAVKILTSEGIQDESDISITFEPSFQKLFFHEVSVYRAGKKINKLADHEIRTLKLETSHERFLYNERVQAVINLRDIRVGDVIVYACTRKGINPLLDGHWASTIDLNYGEPVLEIKNRLIKRQDRPLKMTYSGPPLEYEEHNLPEGKEYIWNLDTVEAAHFDKNMPAWYNPYRELAYTDHASWKEVVQLIAPHYQIDAQELADLRQELTKIIREDSSMTVIQQAIRFVQDDVRYLGFESGIHAYQPHSPLQVLNQRFGDCKDKSFLLCAMLKAYDVTAYPLLVNTDLKEYVREELPSFSAFDHCVVIVELSDEYFCIDPTINFQGGETSNMAFPDYGYGLVIKKGENKLTKLPRSQKRPIKVYQEFTFPNEKDSITFTVKTISYGANADYQRSRFANQSKDEITQTFLEFYSNEYPGISVLSPIEIEDSRDYDNEFIILESYRMPNPAVVSTEKREAMDFDFYAIDMDDYLSVTKSPARSAPYVIKEMPSISCEIKLHFPNRAYGYIDKKTFQNEAYRYDFISGISGKTVTLYHSYESFADYIDSDKVPAYIQAHEEMRDYLFYTATFNAGKEAFSKFGLEWWIIALGIMGFAAARYRKIRSTQAKNKMK